MHSLRTIGAILFLLAQPAAYSSNKFNKLSLELDQEKSEQNETEICCICWEKTAPLLPIDNFCNSCKDAFYHKDCMKAWTSDKDDPPCPMCNLPPVRPLTLLESDVNKRLEFLLSGSSQKFEGEYVPIIVRQKIRLEGLKLKFYLNPLEHLNLHRLKRFAKVVGREGITTMCDFENKPLARLKVQKIQKVKKSNKRFYQFARRRVTFAWDSEQGLSFPKLISEPASSSFLSCFTSGGDEGIFELDFSLADSGPNQTAELKQIRANVQIHPGILSLYAITAEGENLILELREIKREKLQRIYSLQFFSPLTPLQAFALVASWFSQVRQ